MTHKRNRLQGERLAHCMEHLSAYEKSDLTLYDYCQGKLNFDGEPLWHNQMLYWKKKKNKLNIKSTTDGLSEQVKSDLNIFTEIKPPHPDLFEKKEEPIKDTNDKPIKQKEPIVLSLGGNISISITENFDKSTLKNIIDCLGETNAKN